jgi:hypothetical protein
MKKSRLITLGILAATAMACDDDNTSEEVQHCVDADGVVVDEALCNPDAGAAINQDPNVPQHPVIIYRWYYGGSRVYTPGSRIIINSGGGWAPSPGHSYSAPSTIGKGGFGATGHGAAGGGGE